MMGEIRGGGVTILIVFVNTCNMCWRNVELKSQDVKK